MESQSKINSLALLQQQQKTTNQLNSLLEKSAEAIMCGPTCQKMKTTQELEQKYLNAQTNMQTAPIQLEQSRKSYYEFKEGSGAYNTMLEEDLQKKADEIGKLITEKFNEEVQRANIMNSYLNSQIVNSKNTVELYASYTQKNSDMEKEIKRSYGDVLTSDRKSYYETQELDGLQNWHTIFIVTYYILTVVFILGTLFSPNTMSVTQKIGIIFLLAIYPFIIDIIASYVGGILYKIQLPKNVYNG